MLALLIRRSIRKDLRTGSLRILIMALIVAVAAVSAVGFFTDRVSRAMQQQASDLLAADLLLRSSHPLPALLFERAGQAGLKIAQTVTFPSVVLNDEDDSQLVAVKAVSENYPLRGRLLAADIDQGEKPYRSSPPESGAVLVDSILIDLLDLSFKSPLLLGRLEFAVSASVHTEPDRGGELFQMAPRVMMNLEDIEAAGLLVEGSRARYSLLLSGEKQQLQAFRKWYAGHEQAGVELRDAHNARPEIQRVLNQVGKFFGLAAMVTVLLSGAAIALSVRQYAHQQANAGAILRTLGADRRTVFLWMILRLALMALFALLVGLLLGLLAQTVLSILLGSWFQVDLPAAGWRPVIGAVSVTLLTLAGFASLPLIRAGAVPVLSVLRQELGELGVSGRLTASTALLAASLMMYLQSGDIKLVLLLMLGLICVTLVFSLSGGFLYRMMRYLTPPRWSMAKFVLRRRMDVTLLQLSTFGLTIMALLLISVIRDDILQAWQKDISPDAPNNFIVNIQVDQVEGVLSLLRDNVDFTGELYPISRGRLVAINGDNAERKFAENEEAQGLLRHEFNLSYADEMPFHNRLTEGDWWSADEPGNWLSAESGFMERLNLKVGDELTFHVAGIERRAVIRNVREVEWESFQVNFFVITSGNTLQDLPTTFITSFNQPSENAELLSKLVKNHPGITVIDVGKMLNRVRDIINRAALAVQSVFFFTIMAGIIVLLSAVQSSQSSRMRELAILRSMGASHKQVRQSVILEFSLMGATAGFLAAFFASAIAWMIGNFVLNVPIGINALVWLYGTLGGAVIVGIAGYLASRSVLTVPPLSALKNSAG